MVRISGDDARLAKLFDKDRSGAATLSHRTSGWSRDLSITNVDLAQSE